MSNGKNHITHLTAELIEKYQQGLLSENEQYQVERLMLSSPFDQEAEEGFALNNGDILNDLQTLNEKLESRISEEKNDPIFIWLKVAASVIILILSGYLVWDLSNDSSIEAIGEQELSTTASPLKDDSASAADTSSLAKNFLSVIKESISESSPKESSNQAQETTEASFDEVEEELIKTEKTEDLLPISELADNEAEDDDQVFDELYDEEMAKVEISQSENSELEAAPIEGIAGVQASEKLSNVQARSSTGTRRAKKSAGHDNYRIKGSVVSAADGSTLPGVNVIAKGSSLGTVTNQEGQFTFDSLSDENNSLILSFIGFETKEVLVDTQSALDIEMEEDQQSLSEIVVEGYGVSPIELNYIKATPEVGIKAYKQYIKDGIRYDNNASKKGKVIVAFDIEKDGSLSNLVIKRSLGEWEDQEAIRLIREGPSWKPAEKGGGKIRSSARVVIKFNKK